MPRSGEEARRRLHRAATELFLEHGFDAVTTAEIAERAGLTERTFFRHFPDKREVLFEGETTLAEAMTAAVAGAPEGEPPLPVLVRACHAAVPIVEQNRPVTEPLARVFATTPALQERQAAKGARLVELLAEALGERGVDRDLALLAAQTAWTTLSQATRHWMADPAGGLAAQVDQAFRQLGALVAELG
ncbi:TetR family transcriptional regulator [Amycolatopsis sp. PS_44_ISF1]|uniref:TetR/AcrR family transcriptional regulator n=1 Tax=Amycolatopsis sp. PS_44_ISF1 TaxID=2974917 RepID=UPI0028DF5527|nr:TetR family transcriptional regulator [Amycolatopsis sp. PS_44_ISF1]MDT8913768.1 TetR/AcrR family transcriptional regulator [Amycolatopsis sp. PS_44_ISF1]